MTCGFGFPLRMYSISECEYQTWRGCTSFLQMIASVATSFLFPPLYIQADCNSYNLIKLLNFVIWTLFVLTWKVVYNFVCERLIELCQRFDNWHQYEITQVLHIGSKIYYHYKLLLTSFTLCSGESRLS